MAVLNFKQVMAEYKMKFAKKDDGKTGLVAANYEQYRDYLNEIFRVIGVDAKYFKEGFNENMPFMFSEEDTDVICRMLNEFTEEEMLLIRRGEYLDVDPGTIKYYIDSFTAMLQHLGIEEEVIFQQRKQMEEQTLFKFAYAMKKAKVAVNDILMDLENEFFKDDNLSLDDKVEFLNYIEQELNSLQEKLRRVYVQFDDFRTHEGFKSEVNALKQMDKNSKNKFMKNAIRIVELDKKLQENSRYMELYNRREEIINDSSLLKNKAKLLKPINDELSEISQKVQMELFGETIVHESIYGDTEPVFSDSKKGLSSALEIYYAIEKAREHSTAENPLIADILYNQRFR